MKLKSGFRDARIEYTRDMKPYISLTPHSVREIRKRRRDNATRTRCMCRFLISIRSTHFELWEISNGILYYLDSANKVVCVCVVA
jgi:hypothetical protein